MAPKDLFIGRLLSKTRRFRFKVFFSSLYVENNMVMS